MQHAKTRHACGYMRMPHAANMPTTHADDYRHRARRHPH